MPKFSAKSKKKLETCDIRIQNIFNEVIKHIDCTILEGYRGSGRQNELYRTGKSQLRYPNGKHNSEPSLAVDVMPYPIDWKDRERVTLFAGFVLGIARHQGVILTWGGDWDNDWRVKDNNFDDLPHYQILEIE